MNREECFEYFGRKAPFKNKCDLCESKETRVQPQSNKTFCINCFDQTNWWVHPRVKEWNDQWKIKEKTFNEWLNHIKKYGTINLGECPSNKI